MKRMLLMYLMVFLVAVVGCNKETDKKSDDKMAELQKQIQELKAQQNTNKKDDTTAELQKQIIELQKQRQELELKQEANALEQANESIKENQDNPTIIDDVFVLEDGASKSYKIQAGIYYIEMTASDDGVSLEFLGTTAKSIEYKKEWSGTVLYDKIGQMIITNPTTFGLGASSSVTLKVTCK